MNVAAYPKYKESGVEWLGAVPAHWTIKSIKWLSPVLRGASPRPIDDPKYFDDKGEYAWVRIADSTASDGRLTETTQRLSELGSTLSVRLEPGQLFVSIAGTVGKPCITDIKACIHDGFVYFPQLSLEPKFLYRIFEAGLCYGGLGKMGTQLNLNTDTIGSIRVAVPPADELKQILSFLDRETGKIDALVEEQRRLIALLKEKRQAVISHAVTKGLNPNAPMKDSGIEWLGEVPAHWEVRRLRFVSKIETGDADTADAEEDGEYPFFVRSPTIERINRYSFDCEAVLTAGDGAGVGKIYHHFTGQFCAHQRVYIFSDFQDVTGRFFYHYLVANFHKVALEGGAKSTVDSLRRPLIANFWMTIPTPTEQGDIITAVDEMDGAFDRLVAQAEAGIVLLQERRAALISAAVTGKIDVRGLAGEEGVAA